ncbi:brefeldin A-inhibited guanine nucleotide-exchange protein 3-like isoform X3 [Daphnia pulex]|uniref:brefeldin A-inhibited guanine nucleotide-exchange protein 3-like isoform X3 n=1 Tax=Daphnia pulex TaxID=6669 RepID=UPI001EDE5885|nr:brefeldin A-inhibited guanine nucleotide-exchange protein 3-like isoform X3 [Daphnia pulex]
MAMENLLKCLVRDSQALGRGFLHIKQQSQVALEMLESQTGLMQSTPHELREKCFISLHSALVSNSGHLLKLGLMGVQKLLRDNHFVSKHCDPPDDSQWLLSQLLDCLSFPSWVKVSEEVQIEMTKIYISFACLESKFLNLNAHVIVDLLTRLLDMGQSGGIRSRKHQVALQTASVQNLQTFGKNIAISVTLNPQNLVPGDCDVNQVIPIIQFLCDKLEDGLVTAQVFPVEFSLESIQALLSNLPDGVVLNSRSHSFVWRTLCPTLLKLVGVPCPNAPATTDSKISELRCVASIGCELLRLFGNVNVLRAPLESLFHRLLVTDHIATRIEMFKTIKEVFSKPHRLLVIGGPFLVEGSNQETFPEPNEFGILRVLFDGMEESMQTDNVELRTIVLTCANTLLTSLLSLTGSPTSVQISDSFMEKINLLYDDLESCDYIGALSYPTRLRLPKTYEQLLKDQTTIPVKPPTIMIDLTHLLEDEEAAETVVANNDDDNCSTTSGVTEGPEIVDQDVESVDKEPENDIELFGANDGYAARSNHVDLERLAARKFLEDLQSFIPNLGSWRSPLEVDLALQQFASNYCEDAGQDHVIFNADGIYLATYVTLLLNFELAKREYYPSRTGFVAQSEDDFIASVLNSGILVYLTPEFLAELYQGVLVSDVIGNAGFNVNADSNTSMMFSCAFINLLTDVRQVKCPEQATCFLSDCRKLHFAFTPNFLLREPRRQAGLKFARRLLTCFWDSFLFIYSNGVSPTSNETDNQAISQALECLQNAAKLANILGLQDRSGTIFSLLASVACGNPQLGSALVRQKSSLKNRLMKARLAGLISKPVFDIDLPHILSLDVVLNKGLELASYNKEAWTHILRCCLYVTELERRVYQSRKTDRFKVATQLKQYTSKIKWKLRNSVGSKDQQGDDLNLSSAAFGGLDDESSSTDSYSFLTAASQLPNNDNDIQQLLDKAVKCDNYRNTGQLDSKLLARIIGVLSERVDLLMEDAAAKLNLKSLLLLIEELCQLCHVQLNHLDEDNISLQCHWVLHRIGEVMLRSVKTGRPLYHALHCWAIVGPTLLKAACSSDSAIAKTSVEILRSIISHVLQEQPEPLHFHFNEALFKPFEHVLCRENLDPDLQDQVMSSLCELVECWSGEIRSGWRPLFACLRRWPPPPQGPTDICSTSRLIHSENISTVKEVLAAFVQQGGSHPLIFANAAMDAILCQLHYLKCYRYVAELSDPALDNLQKFAKMLGQLCREPHQTPVFYSAMSLTFLPNECDFEPLIALALEHREQMDAEEYGCWSSLFEVLRPQSGHAVKLWENPTGIYKVFYLLLDGVTCCLTHAKDPVQKSIGEVVMATLILLIDIQVHLQNISIASSFLVLYCRVRVCSSLPEMFHSTWDESLVDWSVEH